MKNRGGLFSRLSTFLPALGLLLALGEALFCGSAAGQDIAKGMNTDAAETATDEFMLEEIQVTAQFHEQYVQDTPIAITAVTTEMMEQRSQTDLSSIAAQAPNVVLIETGGAFGPGMSAYIRGVGQSDFNPAFEPGVGIYIDDVYYPSLTGANFDLLDLERVEISRGPQGVLGGRNSEGGSIKLYSEKPRGGGGSFRATFGTRNLQDIRASGDFSLVTDTLFMRLSSASRKQDGYVKRYDYACLFPDSGIPGNGQQGDCFLGTQGGKDYTASRAALRWLASDAVEVNLSADYSLDSSEVAAITLQDAVSTPGNGSNGIEYDSKFVPSDPYISYAGYTSVQPDGRTLSYPPTTRTEVWGTNLNLDWTLTDGLALKSITSYREFDSRWVEDNDVSPLGGSLGSEHVFNDSFSEELRLNGIVFKDAVDYTFGAYYFDQTTTYQTHQVLNYAFPGFEFLGDDLVDASSYAGFFNASWHVTGAMNVNAGVRYTHDEKDYAYSRLPVGDSVTLGLEALNGAVGAYESSKVDYRVNVDYRITDRILSYAGVATAFKGGGSNARPFFPSQAVPFDKEELTAYELGAKTDSLGKRLRINASVFFNDYKDIQMIMLTCDEISPFPGAPCAATYNAGDAEVKGAEIEVLAVPVEGLLIELTASTLDFEYTRANPSTGVVVGGKAKGIIDDKYSMGIQYDVFLTNGATLTPRLDYNYQSDFYTNTVFAESNHVKGYGLLNGRLTWRPPARDWEASLIGKNLTDKEYYLSNFDRMSLSAGSQYGIIGPPREFSIQIKKNF